MISKGAAEAGWLRWPRAAEFGVCRENQGVFFLQSTLQLPTAPWLVCRDGSRRFWW